MSLAASTPRMTLDKTPCNNIGKAEDQPCNVTDDNLKSDCYESMHAFKKIRTSTSGLRKSPNKWTKEENQKLAALVAHYGEKKWKRISAEMGGQKTGAQCAQHWKRVLSPEIRKGHWDENEEDLLLRLVVQYGSCWKKIAKKIPQRTDIQCRYQYLKAKQSREVKWDAKEDESLIKKVMEMANCTFFKFVNDGASCTTINSYDTPTSGYANSLAGSSNTMTSPMSLSSVINNNKENENDNHARNFRLSSSVNSDLSDDRSSLRSSGGSSSGSGSETDSKDTDVSMSDSTSDLRASSSSISGVTMEKDGASCHPVPATNASFNNNLGVAMHKVIWLDIAEHMARMKLTSTLRTALECKTRFLELVGNISVSGSPTNGPDIKPFDLKASGGINAPSEARNAASHPTSSPSTTSPSFLHRTPSSSNSSSSGTSPNDTNININISNASEHNNNHISITNYSRNITINITNSPTNSTRFPHTNNTTYNPRPQSSPSLPHNMNGTVVKTENMETSPTTSTRASMSTSTSTTTASTTNSNNNNSPTNNNNLSIPNAPSFPSFPHFSPVAQPLAATAKPARSPSSNSNNGSVMMNSYNTPNNNNNNNNNNSNNSNNNGSGGGMGPISGLDSLAAVASILPRELLADYAQF